jgi:hypothetical protein
VSRDLIPSEGARFLFERERDDGARAEYRVAIYTPEAIFEGHAILTDDGSVELELAAPDELVATARTFAKLIARSAAKKREDGLPPWPARVLRWRGPVGGGTDRGPR